MVGGGENMDPLIANNAAILRKPGFAPAGAWAFRRVQRARKLSWRHAILCGLFQAMKWYAGFRYRELGPTQ